MAKEEIRQMAKRHRCQYHDDVVEDLRGLLQGHEGQGDNQAVHQVEAVIGGHGLVCALAPQLVPEGLPQVEEADLHLEW